MRIFNQEKTVEIKEGEYDTDYYYTQPDKLFIAHHDYIPEVKKKSHYKVIATYDSGGKDVEEIIDIPYRPAVEAYDEYEDILVIIPYTEEQLNSIKYNKLNNWFDSKYTMYEQMLTRRAYLGIDDEIVDEFRNKTYNSLKDLYQEAEVVAGEIKLLKEV